MTTQNNSRTQSVQTHKHTHTFTHIRIHANYSEFPLKLFPAASSASIDIGIVIHPSIHPSSFSSLRSLFLGYSLWLLFQWLVFLFSSTTTPSFGHRKLQTITQPDTRAQIRCETKLFPVHKYRTTAAAPTTTTKVTTTCSLIYKQKTTHHI